MDELVNYGIAKHVVAIHDGKFYKVMLCDEKNRMYTIEELTKDEWARNREKFFLKNATNAATLSEIESAAFILVLDDAEYFNDP
ncbi:hypothetical protein TELCIR_23825, partial [Teladorsagia circumcincta]